MQKSRWDSDEDSQSENEKSSRKAQKKADRKRRKEAAAPEQQTKKHKHEEDDASLGQEQHVVQGPRMGPTREDAFVMSEEDLNKYYALQSNPTVPVQREDVEDFDDASDKDRFDWETNRLLKPCRHVDQFEKLNRIDEGTYGVVYRARDTETGQIMALKRLKVLSDEQNGFPVTSLREISSLLELEHQNIVNLREIVVSDAQDGIFMVMDFMEHDLKGLMEHAMPHPFLQSEVKTILRQVLEGVSYLHDHWLIHRDLKTSNLLMNNEGQVKIADFGLARPFGEPQPPMTPLVVTLWYRAPELLLGSSSYSTPIDVWSVGCIFGELVLHEPLLPGTSELDQINKIFKLLGTPTERDWPGFNDLPHVRSFNFSTSAVSTLSTRFAGRITEQGVQLLSRCLCYDPNQRITATHALAHGWFKESPLPKHPSMFPSWPSKGEGQVRIKSPSEHAMRGGDDELAALYEQKDAKTAFRLHF